MNTQMGLLVNSFSHEYGVNPTWIMAIIQQESAWNIYALRIEPHYEYLFKPEIFAKKLNISLNTEVMTQKMSFGLGQIMLALAREQGFDGPAGLLFDPATNIKHIAIRLRDLTKISNEADDVFAMYNAGPGGLHKADGVYKNQAYVDSVKTHLQTITG